LPVLRLNGPVDTIRALKKRLLGGAAGGREAGPAPGFPGARGGALDLDQEAGDLERPAAAFSQHEARFEHDPHAPSRPPRTANPRSTLIPWPSSKPQNAINILSTN
jgi:hypothetical protein